MKYTNILEKILCLFNIVKTSWIDIGFLLVVVISLILLFSKKISSRVCYIINVVASIVLISLVIFNNIDILGKTFDSIVDYTFTNIYFPSIYVYLLVLVVLNVVSIFSLFKARLEKKYKIVNGISMLFMNFVLAIILDIVAVNKVDLFKKESVFTNTDLVVMLELSINIFLVWCLVNLIMYLSDNITDRILIRKNNKGLIKDAVNMNVLNVSVNEEEVIDDYVSNNAVSEGVKDESVSVSTLSLDTADEIKNKFIPDFININNNLGDNGFDLSSLIPVKNEVSPINNISYENSVYDNNYNDSSELLNCILNNDLPFIVKEEKNERDTYTLNDYRIFNKMLKDIKEHNNSNRISIDKNLEYRLITKYSTEAYDMFKKMLKNYSN